MMIWDTFILLLSWALIVSGSIFTLIGAVGILRFPDFWSRLHAASITDSAGLILLLAGMCLHSGLTLVTVKLIIIGIFLFITGSDFNPRRGKCRTGIGPQADRGRGAGRRRAARPNQFRH